MKNLLTIAMIFCTLTAFGQDYKIGVRAGANYTQFNGPLETAVNEDFSLSGGFHFGFNFTYYLIEKLGLRLELMYLQNGTNQTISGDSYALIKIPNSSLVFKEEGNRQQNLKISNAYISVPITIQYQLNKKFEFFGGVYTNFLIGPTAGGKYVFNSKTSETDEDGIFFTQSLIYDYNSDFAGARKSSILDPVINLNGTEIIVPGAIGAYYYEDEVVTDSYINALDLGLTAGLNYFVNRGFYVGTRIVYGMRDITNSRFDYSLEDLDDNNLFIQRNDEDKIIGFDVSLGFRF